jgi:hypothetical protein
VKFFSAIARAHLARAVDLRRAGPRALRRVVGRRQHDLEAAELAFLRREEGEIGAIEARSCGSQESVPPSAARRWCAPGA